MRAIRITATVLLTVLLLATGIAAQAVAFLKATALNPGFYGARQHAAYMLISQTILRKMTDAVLERAPVVSLKSTDAEQAYALAAEALPPQKIAAMLEKSGPDIAHFLISGGDLPVLKGSEEFAAGEVAVVRNLLMDGLWDMVPDKPSFPAFMPFTPEWNLVYGPALTKNLWLAHYYLSMTDQVLWLLVSGLALWVGLLYLVWLKRPKPFFTITGAALALNSVLVLALAAAVAYLCQPMAKGAEVWRPLSGVADLFGAAYPTLFRTVLWPFRDVFFQTAVLSFTFSITMITLGISRNQPMPQWAGQSKPAVDAPMSLSQNRKAKKIPQPAVKMLAPDITGEPAQQIEAPAAALPMAQSAEQAEEDRVPDKSQPEASPISMLKNPKHKKKP